MKKEDTWIHSVCSMCLGDCGILVHRVDGVVVDIKGDPDCPVNLGKLCPKGYSGIMTLYDPSRVKTPLKRTNPEKGIGVDPGWVQISWDEAFDIMVEKLTKLRKEDPRKLVFSTFDTYTMREKMTPFAKAFGTPNTQWQGYYCGQYLHSSMYLTNGTFHCDYDQEHVNYLILFGNQHGFMAGLNPNIATQKMAEGRKRGLKVVVVDPVCGSAGSNADEWVPIRPGTDAALEFSMINVLLNDLEIYDRPFIKKYTNGPYLVKPDGYYIRQGNKPLVWDTVEGKAKPYDAEVKDYAILGSYSVDGIECKPAFQVLKEHVKKYTPEMASEITTVPAATIRRLAEEFGKEARIGSTIVVEGVEFPYRPVAANIYRGAGSHKHGVAFALGVITLNMIVGSFYVPGSHRGLNLIGPDWEWEPGEYEGLITPPNNSEVSHGGTNYYKYEVKPPVTSNLKELFPMSSNWSPMNLATSLNPEKFKLPYKPEILITSRRNLLMGGCDYNVTSDALKQYKFIITFCITLDEMSEFADLVLPDAVYLEKLETLPNKLNWSHTAQTGYFYWGIRQPVVEPVGETRDWGDVLVEVADRMGFLGDVYKHMNDYFTMKDPYKLDPARKYTLEEINDRKLKSKFGDDKGLEWFKKNGFVVRKRKVDEMYPLPWLKVRFPLYFENFIEAGKRVKVTDRLGLKDWDISDYEALPDWKPCASYAPSEGFDLKIVTYRVPTHYQSWTAQNPWLSEVAELNPYAQKILIHTSAAKSRGIKNKDTICVESSVGKVVGKAKVTECIHPEVIGVASHFGSYVKGKPVACGKGVNFNKLVPYDRDPVSTGVDACVAVKVYKM
jgi:anaerobic selenocysteine-containing dehydrogenase